MIENDIWTISAEVILKVGRNSYHVNETYRTRPDSFKKD